MTTPWDNTKHCLKKSRNVIKKKWNVLKIWYERKCENLVLDFCNQTNIHGFQQMATPAHVNLKIGWVVFCVLCMLIMYFAVGSLLASYSGSNISTSITHHIPGAFPTVLFCPQSWLDTKKIATLVPKENTTRYAPISTLNILILMLSYENFQLVWNVTAVNQPPFNLTETNMLLDELMAYNSIPSVHELYQRVAYNCSDIITQPRFVRHIRPFVRASRVCCRVTFNEAEQLESGRLRSFVYKLPMPTLANSESSSVLAAPYHTILIGDDDSSSKLSQNSLEITKGVDFRFSIQVSQHLHYNTKHTPCNKSNKSASLQQCITDCQDAFIRTSFGCSFYFGQESDPINSSYCLRESNVTTPRELVESMPGNLSDKTSQNQCYETCIIPCLMNVYDPVILSLGKHRQQARAYQSAQLTFQYQNYYASLDYDDSISNSWSSIMSNIGGMVSLCSGASFIAVAHVFYHFLLRQICPRPRTVQSLTMRLSESAVNVVKASHENLGKIKQKVPLWKKSLMAAQASGHKIATTMEPKIERTRKQMRKISAIRAPQSTPKIVIELSQTPDITPKISTTENPTKSNLQPSPAVSIRKLIGKNSIRNKLASMIPNIKNSESYTVATLDIPSLDEATKIMKESEAPSNALYFESQTSRWSISSDVSETSRNNPETSSDQDIISTDIEMALTNSHKIDYVKPSIHNRVNCEEVHENDGLNSGESFVQATSAQDKGPITTTKWYLTDEETENCSELDPEED